MPSFPTRRSSDLASPNGPETKGLGTCCGPAMSCPFPMPASSRTSSRPKRADLAFTASPEPLLARLIIPRLRDRRFKSYPRNHFTDEVHSPRLPPAECSRKILHRAQLCPLSLHDALPIWLLQMDPKQRALEPAVDQRSHVPFRCPQAREPPQGPKGRIWPLPHHRSRSSPGS